MTKAEIHQIETRLKNWKRLEQSHYNWLKKHRPDHPDWSFKSSQMNQASLKIEQLKETLNPPNQNVGVSYSLPIFNNK